MAITLKNKNFGVSKLLSGIASGATQLTVLAGEGSKFPTSGQFRAVLWSQSYESPIQDGTREIVTMQLSAGDVFDITRAQESTSAKAWNANDNVAHVITAGKVDELETEINAKALASDLATHTGGTAKDQHTGGLGTHTHQGAGAEGGKLDHGLALDGLADNDHPQYKLDNVSATDKVLGRQSAGAGAIEEIACTAAGRALIDDADAAAQRTTLGVKTQAEIIGAIYPVGSIYISTLSTNPGTLLGVGTWAAFGAGRALVGLDAGQAEFDTVEETGGAKTHALSEAELAAHTHPLQSGGVTKAFWGEQTTDAGSRDIGAGSYTVSLMAVGSAGSGTAHNNLQPYIVCYFWKRTA